MYGFLDMSVGITYFAGVVFKSIVKLKRGS